MTDSILIMKINFTKMHGLGNDFILIDCLHLKECRFRNADFGILSKHLCDRRFGIGADQLLLLCSSRTADFRMRIFNSDGSEVEMCGNGIRCLAKYIWDRNLSRSDILEIETLSGIIKPSRVGEMIKVDMGEPIFEPGKIPVTIQNSELRSQKSEKNLKLKSQISNMIIDYPLEVDRRTFKITCVSMGNPHAVILVDNVSDFSVTYYGPMIEKHSIFPQRTNVEFIEILSPLEIRVRVWERGSGETMACGTGASAAAIVSHLKGLTEKRTTVHLPGGDLFIEWGDGNHIYMTGPAVEVYKGIIDNNIFAAPKKRG